MKKFKLLSINISKAKGEKKTPIEEATLTIDHGIEGDAHAGNWHRQISLLGIEEIQTMKEKGLELSHGDFAENLTTEGIDLPQLPIGSKLYIDQTVLEITQIGKECHNRCNIYDAVGDCIMPHKGIFAKVLKGGKINIESNCHYDI